MEWCSIAAHHCQVDRPAEAGTDLVALPIQNKIDDRQKHCHPCMLMIGLCQIVIIVNNDKPFLYSTGSNLSVTIPVQWEEGRPLLAVHQQQIQVEEGHLARQGMQVEDP